VESGMNRIGVVQNGSFKVLAGGAAGFQDGPASTARFLPYLGLALLSDGALAVADPGNYLVRRIAAGQVSTLAGSAAFGIRDGPADEADLVLPAGLAVGADGTLYVAEPGNGAIRAIGP
jgi:hypothetical protein